jgi:hypothetical protein
LFYLFSPNPRNRHFDRSRSSFCEQGAKKSAFLPKVQFSQNAFVVACSCCHHLSLLVLAVILSAAKDPEELNEPTPSVRFNPYSSAPLPLSVLFSSNPRNRRFDRRTEEICFSPPLLPLAGHCWHRSMDGLLMMVSF